MSVEMRDDIVNGRHGLLGIRRYGPPASALAPLIWLHGGAFSAGGLDQQESDAPARAVASTGRPVVTVDYSLVPQWSPFRKPKLPLTGVRYPIPLEDVIDVIEHVGSESGRYVLGGASAGAALAASATKRLSGEQKLTPQALVLAYGLFHSSLPPMQPELRSRVSGVHGILQFNPRVVEIVNINYLGSPDLLDDPIAFPGGHGNLAGFPKTLMIDADRDTLRASGAAFASELRAEGIDLTYVTIPRSVHGFFDKPESASFSQGISELLTFLDHVDN